MESRYYSPNEYTKLGIISIPPGDHRVKIINVTEKVYGESGKKGFEITLRVSGRRGLLWYYLIRDPENEEKFYKKLHAFFYSFNITDRNLANYKNWVGKYGAVRVRHSVDTETGLIKAYIYYCLCGIRQDILPSFRDLTIQQS